MRIWIALSIPVIAVFALSSCGGSEIAKIGDSVSVSQGSYDRWLQSAVAAAENSGRPLDSPQFSACQKKIGQTNAAGQKACRDQYDALRKQVFAQLIQQGWVLAAADKANVKFGNKQVQEQVKALRKQFPATDGGVNNDDLVELARVNLAQGQLQQQTLALIKPSDNQLKAFYNKNKKRFATPATRDANIIITASKKKATAAADALRSGQSWSRVFRKYNDVKLYNSRRPQANNVTPGSFTPSLGRVVFSAPVKTVYGPKEVKQINGWVVVEVDKASAAKASPAFAQNKEQALAAYRADALTKKSSVSPVKLAQIWQPQTVCAEEYQAWYPCKGTKSNTAN